VTSLGNVRPAGEGPGDVGLPSSAGAGNPLLLHDGSDRVLAGLDLQEARGPAAAGGAYELGDLVEDRKADRGPTVLELVFQQLSLLDMHPFER
jgi:hypothetical protein